MRKSLGVTITLASSLLSACTMPYAVNPAETEAHFSQFTVPAAPEVVVIPAKFTQCQMQDPKVIDGTWIPAYLVCDYAKHRRWHIAHWECSNYNLSTKRCLVWHWQVGYWQSS